MISIVFIKHKFSEVIGEAILNKCGSNCNLIMLLLWKYALVTVLILKKMQFKIGTAAGIKQQLSIEISDKWACSRNPADIGCQPRIAGIVGLRRNTCGSL